MGAKARLRTRPNSGVYKCKICNRHLLSALALQSHIKCIHNKVTKKTNEKAAGNKKKILISKKMKKNQRPNKRASIKPTPVFKKASVKQSKTPQMAKKIPLTNTEKENKLEESSVPVQTSRIKRKTGFECPICCKTFTVYFPAMKHIQKAHCVNKKGEKVDPKSSDLITPIPIEYCVDCNTQLKSSESHTCQSENIDVMNITSYTCLACDELMHNIDKVEEHLKAFHNKLVDNIFFSSYNDFFQWRSEVEESTKNKYSILSKQQNKQVYHCMFKPMPKIKQYDPTTVYFCSSCIVVEQLPKGIKVQFYKEHENHDSKVYILPLKHKIHTAKMIDEMPGLFQEKTKTQLTNAYEEFKKLMEKITDDAVNVNLDTLKKLHCKALDMTSLLHNIVNKESVSILTKKEKLSDNQICEVLEIKQEDKRKSLLNNPDVRPVKRSRNKSIVIEDHKIDNGTNSENPTESTVHENLGQDLKSIVTETSPSQSPNTVQNQLSKTPQSFNDSYKSFVDQCNRIYKKRNIVKTKIGQFKPSLSPKNKQNSTEANLNEKKIKKYEMNLDMPSGIKKSNFLRNNTNKHSQNHQSIPVSETKDVIKVGRKSKVGTKNPSSPLLGTIKVEKYEIQEQENDCNILILKI